MVKALRLGGVLDRNHHWCGGKPHLVQVGDLLDQGPDSPKIMDLLMVLEKEAITETYAVRRVVVGHTVNLNGIATRANGQVILIDVGMSCRYRGKAACLVIKDGKAFAVTEKVPAPRLGKMSTNEKGITLASYCYLG